MAAPGPGFGLFEIGQIALVVSELARATAFYRDALGMRLLFEVPGMAFFDCAGIRLMLTLPEPGKSAGTNSVLYFKVAEIQAAHDALGARGVAFVGPPHKIARLADHDLWMAFFRDPDQNLLALMSEVPHAAPGKQ
ncbi:MAG: VOC family protein [Pirellulales bacterium]